MTKGRIILESSWEKHCVNVQADVHLVNVWNVQEPLTEMYVGNSSSMLGRSYNGLQIVVLPAVGPCDSWALFLVEAGVKPKEK